MSSKILFVSHDANRAGSQLLLLQLLKHLKAINVPMHLLLAEGGSLLEEFQRVTDVTLLAPPRQSSSSPIKRVIDNYLYRNAEAKRCAALESELKSLGIGLVFVNSIANASLYHTQLTCLHHLPMVLFAHELGMSAKMYAPEVHLRFLLDKSLHLIAVSQAVTKFYTTQYGYPENQVSTFTLIDHAHVDQRIANANRQLLHTNHAIPQEAIVIGSCGNGEFRKGNDLFNWIAFDTLRQAPSLPIYFVWVGIGPQHEIYELVKDDIAKMGIGDRLLLIPPTPQVMDYMSRFDVFLLPSREDPYPLVVTEAALNETPIVCFERGGGAPELVEHDAGFVVPFMSVSLASKALLELVVDPTLRQTMGAKARKKVLERHNTSQSIEKIMVIIEQYVQVPVSEKSV